MAIAFAFVVLAAGLTLIYMGWKGVSASQFWQSIRSGNLPQKGANS